jgi:uncharacterized lipoprotein YajG
MPRYLIILAATMLLAGCESEPDRQRSVAELYQQADEVNRNAEPYRLGTGDGLGAQSYQRHAEQQPTREPRQIERR